MIEKQTIDGVEVQVQYLTATKAPTSKAKATYARLRYPDGSTKLLKVSKP